jgi:hypothetical protein
LALRPWRVQTGTSESPLRIRAAAISGQPDLALEKELMASRRPGEPVVALLRAGALLEAVPFDAIMPMPGRNCQGWPVLSGTICGDSPGAASPSSAGACALHLHSFR